MKTAARKLITKAEPNELELITKAAVRVEEIAAEQKKMAAKVDKHDDAFEKAGLLPRLQELEQIVAKGIKYGDYGASNDGRAQINLEPLFENQTFQRLQKNDKGVPGLQYELGDISIKSLLNDVGATDTAHGNYPGQPNRIPGAHGFALRPLRLLDLLPWVPQTTNSFDYVRVNFTGEADVQDGEGAEKAEMEFNGELIPGKCATIAVHTTASAQVLDDVNDLLATIERVLEHSVLSKAEKQLITGSGTGSSIEGIYTAATAITTYKNEIPDRIGEAITAMATTGYLANVILMNPDDWFEISILKDADGNYIYGNPASPAPPSLWNLPVITSPSVPKGTALVGDTGKVQVRDRMAPTVYISRDHKDYRVRNLVLILIEARLGLAIFDVLAFRKVDLSVAT